MKRVSFNSGKIRDSFFEKCLTSNGFSMWKELSEFVKVDRKVLGQYRKGLLTLPCNLFERLIKRFSHEDKEYFMKKISFLDSNWGQVKGGNIVYLKNKRYFDQGRESAIKIAKDKVKVFDINMSLSEDLSYFVGVFIGDGFANKYSRSHIVQFTGQYSQELDYYNNIVVGIGVKYFGLIPRIRKEKGCDAIRVTYCSKYLHDFLVKRLKIIAGRKSSGVLIPQEILASDEKVVLSCIAGLYDAEGCFYFVKERGYKRPYPILDFHINNEPLVRQISDYLNSFHIKNSTWKNKRIVIYGKKNIVDFLKKVKIRNPKLIKRMPKDYF